jgi:hypothetical protein
MTLAMLASALGIAIPAFDRSAMISATGLPVSGARDHDVRDDAGDENPPDPLMRQLVEALVEVKEHQHAGDAHEAERTDGERCGPVARNSHSWLQQLFSSGRMRSPRSPRLRKVPAGTCGWNERARRSPSHIHSGNFPERALRMAKLWRVPLHRIPSNF